MPFSRAAKFQIARMHSMRDGLRAVECPAEIIDQIGGWTTSGVGQQYGEGFTLKIIQRFVKQIE